MNKFHALAALALSVAAVGSAQAQIGVSINVRQPGVYGRIDIGGGYPPPPVILPQPVLIAPPSVIVPRAPIYLYVSPLEQGDWRHYCGRYNACGQPVYFVQEGWVHDRWVERHPGWDRDHGPRGPRGGWDGRDRGGPGGRGDRGPDRGDGHDRGRGPDRDHR